ncbi:MAG TPA: WYL domain-containing protein [Egibacteraceae bacterium]|nr:WYL domain-containing protein [Egibacteraceae bacterium]
MSRPASTLARLERILTMVPWLLEHPGASVDEVTERFGVSREDVHADLDVLGYCGLPGYGGGDLVEASIVGDRVVVRMADFFRRPLRLSLREAVTLLLAARTVAGVGALPESDALDRAVRKLTDLLGGTLAEGGRKKGAPATVAPRIAVDLSTPGDEHLPALRHAVMDRRVVRITYRSASKSEVTHRDVEPWGLTGSRGSWYLQGYCRMVKAPRDFRLDRIRELEVLDETVDIGERPPATAPPVYQPQPDDERIVLDLGIDAWWVAEWAVVEDVTDRGDTRRVTLRTGEREWVARLVLALGDDVRIVEPPDLVDTVALLAEQALARYRPGSR